MKKAYVSATYDVTVFRLDYDCIMTTSSDLENSYVGSGSIWGEFDFDD